jgi:predicted HTH domain antitoxin
MLARGTHHGRSRRQRGRSYRGAQSPSLVSEFTLGRDGVSLAGVDWLEVVEDALTLVDDFDGESIVFVDVPAEFIARPDIEVSADVRRDRRRERAHEQLEEGRTTFTKTADFAGMSVWDFAQLDRERDVTWVSGDHLDDDLEAQ